MFTSWMYRMFQSVITRDDWSITFPVSARLLHRGQVTNHRREFTAKIHLVSDWWRGGSRVRWEHFHQESGTHSSFLITLDLKIRDTIILRQLGSLFLRFYHYLLTIYCIYCMGN